MAGFTVGKAIVTDTPMIQVDAGLPIGTHRFTLVVTNDKGVESLPATIDVVIYRLLTPPITPTRVPIPRPINRGGPT